jgi:hypothetical protein
MVLSSVSGLPRIVQSAADVQPPHQKSTLDLQGLGEFEAIWGLERGYPIQWLVADHTSDPSFLAPNCRLFFLLSCYISAMSFLTQSNARDQHFRILPKPRATT